MNPGFTKVAVIYRPETPLAFALATEVTKWLDQRGVTVYSSPDQKPVPGTKRAQGKALAGLNFVVVLGGDGTYLKAARWIQGLGVPLIGVNLGSLGFLTPTRSNRIFEVLEKALHGTLLQQSRSMLRVQIRRGRKVTKEFVALNDVVLERGSQSHLIQVQIHSQSSLVCEVKCDGLIVATPTGSSAYNLAAGGPILHPEVPAWSVTPIAAHSLTNRPFLLPDHLEMKLQLMGKNKKADFVVDGQKIAEITEHDRIVLIRNPQDHQMFREPTDDYFHLLREKLKFGERS